MRELYNRFIWKSESGTLFQEALRQADSQASISNFMTTLYDPSDSEIAKLDFTSILVNAGLKSLKIKSTKSKNESNKIGQKWF